MIINIKKTPSEFLRCGYLYRQLLETEQGYVYAVIDPETKNIHAYECFKKMIVPLCIIDNNTGERTIMAGKYKESYPKDSAFGKWAWCFRDAEAASKKLKSIRGASC